MNEPTHQHSQFLIIAGSLEGPGSCLLETAPLELYPPKDTFLIGTPKVNKHTAGEDGREGEESWTTNEPRF